MIGEKLVHYQVVQYLKLQYPDVIFRTDFAAGLKMTIGQARQHKILQSSRAYPDLFIAKPVGNFHGLYIEIKNAEIYKKDGDLKKDEHLQEQAEMLYRLRKLGYEAKFGIGFEECRSIIDKYLYGY
jgi:hypothetical protein